MESESKDSTLCFDNFPFLSPEIATSTFLLPYTENEELLEHLWLDMEIGKELQPWINWAPPGYQAGELSTLKCRLYPCQTARDDDSLLQACHLSMVGSHNNKHMLRNLLALALLEEEFANHFKQIWMASEKAKDATFGEASVQREEKQFQQEWEEIVARTLKVGAFLGSFHIYMLAHILKRPIIVYGDPFIRGSRGERYSPNSLRGIFLPNQLPPAVTHKIPIAIGYTIPYAGHAGYFNALVGMEDDLHTLMLVDEHGVDLPLHFLQDTDKFANDQEEKEHHYEAYFYSLYFKTTEGQMYRCCRIAEGNKQVRQAPECAQLRINMMKIAFKKLDEQAKKLFEKATMMKDLSDKQEIKSRRANEQLFLTLPSNMIFQHNKQKADSSKTQSFQRGDRVEAQFGGGISWYPGHVLDTYRGGVDIAYDDGTVDRALKPKHVRLKPAVLYLTGIEKTAPHSLRLRRSNSLERLSVHPGPHSLRSRRSNSLERLSVHPGPLKNENTAKDAEQSRTTKPSESSSVFHANEFKHGDSVQARWGVSWYEGKIMAVLESGHYRVCFDDGTSTLVQPRNIRHSNKMKLAGNTNEIQANKFAPGDVVKARWGEARMFYYGKIKSISCSGLYEVAFEDGMVSKVQESDICLISESASDESTANLTEKIIKMNLSKSSSEVQTNLFKPGDIVEAQWPNCYSEWYGGKIEKVFHDGSCEVAFADGAYYVVQLKSIRLKIKSSPDESTTEITEKISKMKLSKSSELQTNLFKPGDIVEAQWPNCYGKWYSGKIEKVFHDGSCEVAFYDGIYSVVQQKSIRLKIKVTETCAHKQQKSHNLEKDIALSKHNENDLIYKIGDLEGKLLVSENQFSESSIKIKLLESIITELNKEKQQMLEELHKVKESCTVKEEKIFTLEKNIMECSNKNNALECTIVELNKEKEQMLEDLCQTNLLTLSKERLLELETLTLTNSAKVRETLKKKQREEEEQRLCCICMQHPREIIFLPCGHVCVCANANCLSSTLEKCPLDNLKIDERKRLFL